MHTYGAPGQLCSTVQWALVQSACGLQPHFDDIEWLAHCNAAHACHSAGSKLNHGALAVCARASRLGSELCTCRHTMVYSTCMLQRENTYK